MKRARFAEVGEALYGPSWRAALAGPMRVSERTIRRWEHGEAEIPFGTGEKLGALCREQAGKLTKIADQLEGK